MEKEAILPKNIRQIGDIQGRERICIEDYVMTYIRKKEPQEDQGYLGIFLGERREAGEETYVFIRGILEVSFEETQGTQKETEEQSENAKERREATEDVKTSEEQETRERKKAADAPEGERRKGQAGKTARQSTWQESLARAQAEYFPGWEVQGCCVIGTYQTKQLERLAESVPEASRMIYHLQEQEETLYWREPEQYRRLKGYFVFYEQNRKMQEYLADVFRDDSVEKENVSDRAIQSFREKIKEKGEKKTGSMLKLASSFFVVTVLIIGAIAVNRMDEIRKVRNTAATDWDALSAQTQQEGEHLPAAAYSAQETAASGQGASGSGGASAQETAASGAVSGQGVSAQETAASGAASGQGTSGSGGASAQDMALSGADAPQDDAAAQGESGLNAAAMVADDAAVQAASGSNGVSGQSAASLNEAAASGENSAQSTASGVSAQNADVSSAGTNGASSDAAGASGAEAVNASGTTGENSGSTTSETASGGNGGAASGNNDATGENGSTADGNGGMTGENGSAISENSYATGENGSASGESSSTISKNSNTSVGNGSAAAGTSTEASSRAVRASYTIREGDTLANISSKYYGSIDRVAEICEANHIEDANMIMPGQKIVLP